MSVEVWLDGEGRITGQRRRPLLPLSPARVRVVLDADAPVTVRAPSGAFDLDPPTDPGDGRLHSLRVTTVGGRELEGSPLAWESARPDRPERSFLLRGNASRPEPATSVVFDPEEPALVVPRPRATLHQNRKAVGGLAEHRRYRPWPAYLARFEGACVDPGFGGVYRADGQAWQGSTYLMNSWARGEAERAQAAGELAAPPAGPCVIFCNSVKDTFFHWHIDGLAGLVMARALGAGHASALVPPGLKPWQRASLDLLGETTVEVEGPCAPAATFAPCHLDGRGIYPDRWVVRMFERLKAGRAAEAPRAPGEGEGGRRLFVSRRDAGHRVLANEDALWAALQPRGFTRVAPGEMDYRAQIDAFAAAEVVVASHGSALTNMGFCRPGATVVEILPCDYLNGCFRFLAMALGLRHGWWSSERVDPFEVEVDAFMDWCASEALF